MCEVKRVPIKVKRKAITVASDNGWSIGRWFAFPKPDESPPYLGRISKSQRVLWCPYCDDWTVFDRAGQESWHCLGICGWANTNSFYVKTMNDLWFEDVPTSELKKMSVPASSKGRK